jgi:hypothetical protein
MKFNENLNIDMTQWSKITMVRENLAKKSADGVSKMEEEMPKLVSLLAFTTFLFTDLTSAPYSFFYPGSVPAVNSARNNAKRLVGESMGVT